MPMFNRLAIQFKLFTFESPAPHAISILDMKCLKNRP